MLKKITGLVLLAATWVIFLPSQSAAFSSSERTASVIEYSESNSMTTQRRRRGRGSDDRRWNRNRRMNNNRRVRVIRQVYYRNGRRYVRYVRIYR